MSTLAGGDLAARVLAALGRTHRIAYALIDADLKIAEASPECADLLGSDQAAPGRSLAEIDPAFASMQGALQTLLRDGGDGLELDLAGVGERAIHCLVLPFDVQPPGQGLLAVFEDVTSAAHIRAALQQQGRELAAFGHTVAHDLRTPLAAISIYTQIMEKELPGQVNPEILGYLRDIRLSVLALERLSNNMLLLARVRGSTQALAPVEPGAAIANALASLAAQIEETHARISVMSEPPRVIAHGPWLEEVFANLLQNAIRYGASEHDSPQVTLRWKKHGQMVSFEIADDGPGIPEEVRAHLFEMFTRFDERSEGFGLGLSVVARIVERLNGAIHVDSAPGRGSVFTISLPSA